MCTSYNINSETLAAREKRSKLYVGLPSAGVRLCEQQLGAEHACTALVRLRVLAPLIGIICQQLIHFVLSGGSSDPFSFCTAKIAA